jgi:proteasome lid subunit RPN8/RPN11
MLETLLQSGDTQERCGLLLDDGTVVEVANLHAEPERGCEMDPKAVLKCIKAGGVIGTWHTHPDSDPNLSGEDYSAFLAWPDLRHVIVGMRDGKPTVAEFVVEDGLVMKCD